MRKTFNTNGCCDPEIHYMVDLTDRLKEISRMVDDGCYFTINRARQYGKTTTLNAFADYLQPEYLVICLDFQGLSYADFESEDRFVAAFSRQILLSTQNLKEESREELKQYAAGQTENTTLSMLFISLVNLCKSAGKPVPYSAMNDYIEIAAMFGFVKNVNGAAVISNRIFEMVLYNWFMSDEYGKNRIYDAGVKGKNQFVIGGHLNVRRILERFVESFDDLYGDRDETFLEDAGRRYFMLFLKPIINGEGNCYVEAETRNHERTDLVIDYHGEQFVIECKIWHGNDYNERGERQLTDYLDYFWTL